MKKSRLRGDLLTKMTLLLTKMTRNLTEMTLKLKNLLTKMTLKNGKPLTKMTLARWALRAGCRFPAVLLSAWYGIRKNVGG